MIWELGRDKLSSDIVKHRRPQLPIKCFMDSCLAIFFEQEDVIQGTVFNHEMNELMKLQEYEYLQDFGCIL